VQMGDWQSSCLVIVCGVPQGSALGPKLFILYINDISKVSKILNFVLIADDTNIFCTGDNLQQLLAEINLELCQLKIWFDINKLSLNLDKTKFMLFGNCKSKKNLQILIDDVSMERVDEIKFLGVMIDHKICWKPHIKYIQPKIFRSIAVLSKAKHFLNYAALHILYCSLMLPYLSYSCGWVW